LLKRATTGRSYGGQELGYWGGGEAVDAQGAVVGGDYQVVGVDVGGKVVLVDHLLSTLGAEDNIDLGCLRELSRQQQ
jgi:hypothetical protein